MPRDTREPGPSSGSPVRRWLAAAWRSRARRLAVSAVALALAAFLLYRELRGFTFDQLMAGFRATPVGDLLLAALVLTPASYVCLAVTEWSALHSLGQRLGWPRVGVVAFAAYAFSNSLGFSYATGTAARLRLYSASGLAAKDIAAIAVVAGTAVTLSGVVSAGLALIVDPAQFEAAFRLPASAVIALGALLMAPGLLWFTTLRGRRPETLSQRLAISLGGRALTLGAGVGDWVFSGAALFVLLPQHPLAAFPGFMAVFVLGSLVSAATGVPGGVGVFEAVVIGLSILLARAHETPTALLLYRAIYSVGPMILISGGLFSHGWLKRRPAGAESPPN